MVTEVYETKLIICASSHRSRQNTLLITNLYRRLAVPSDPGEALCFLFVSATVSVCVSWSGAFLGTYGFSQRALRSACFCFLTHIDAVRILECLPSRPLSPHPLRSSGNCVAVFDRCTGCDPTGTCYLPAKYCFFFYFSFFFVDSAQINV